MTEQLNLMSQLRSGTLQGTLPKMVTHKIATYYNNSNDYKEHKATLRKIALGSAVRLLNNDNKDRLWFLIAACIFHEYSPLPAVGVAGIMHVETELKRCGELSKSLGSSVWLKMETQQITGSFKYRGISLLCKKSVDEGYKKFVCSSGGNAGLAATKAAKELGTPISVYVPMTTREVMREMLREGGASVHVHGKVWDETNALAVKTANEEGAFMIHPFDHPTIWEGHSSIVTEIKSQLPSDSAPPDLIIVSVGGGGLMNGILYGMESVGWGHVPFLAMETEGADSLNLCVREGKWDSLNEITSVAKCLGALRVSKRSYEWLQNKNVISCVVPDREALKACVFMSDYHGVLVPPACGAALAALTDKSVISRLQDEGKLSKSLRNVIAIVCGGSGINPDNIEQWRSDIREEKK